jgi:phosphoglycolate phosphatase
MTPPRISRLRIGSFKFNSGLVTGKCCHKPWCDLAWFVVFPILPNNTVKVVFIQNQDMPNPSSRTERTHRIIIPMSLVLFDFDGVLADTLADMLRFAQEVCDELGVKHTVVQIDLSELEVMSFATFGRACEMPEDLVDEFVRKCTGKFAEKKSPPAIYDGLGEVVKKLAESHLLAVVTGNTERNVRAFLKKHKLEGCFCGVYEVDMPGSKVEKILMAKSQFTAGCEEVFMVGDSVSDVRDAREAGVKSIAVSWGHQSLGRLVGAVPDYVVQLPEELIDITKSV